MKKLILSMVAMIIATVSFAQGAKAPPNHDGVINNYYGKSAFIEATNKAKQNYTTTLSEDIFSTISIIT